MKKLVDECIALDHVLRDLARRVHGEGTYSSGRRAVLLELSERGPDTVPRMAKRRPVSRQYMQMLADGLVNDGLARYVANPRHKRSPLLEITAAGRRHLARMLRRESRVLARLEFDSISEARLKTASSTVAAMRGIFEKAGIQ